MADPTAPELYKSDPQLKDIDFEGFRKIPSDEVIERTKSALEAKKWGVSVVSNRKEALEAIKGLIPEGASVFNAHSTSLNEIGFTDFLKTQTVWKNLHTAILAETDPVKQTQKRKEAMLADYWISSVNAVSENGEFVVVDLTGTRTGAFIYTANKVVVVISANKITPTYEDAVKRLYDYSLPLESARVRVAYGVPASQVSNFVGIKHPDPFGAPGRFHFVIVKEPLGF